MANAATHPGPRQGQFALQMPYSHGTAAPHRLRNVVSDVGLRTFGPKLPCGYPSGTQKWNATSLGIWNSAWKRSITVGCSVVGTEPMPIARAASIRFWTAGMTESAGPLPVASAKTMHGASLIASASPAAER